MQDTSEFNKLTINSYASIVAKKYYELKLGSIVDINLNTKIERVPGGWVHITLSHGTYSEIYIPYNNEFQELADS